MMTGRYRLHFLACILAGIMSSIGSGEELSLQLQYQAPIRPGATKYHTQRRDVSWTPNQTAIIVCDVWDLHHCLNAVRRVKEMAPRLDAVLKTAREQGVTIIHAPSDCMDSYLSHPARQRAQHTPSAKQPPRDITSWCSVIPAEEGAEYPIDQSDGGEDDDPAEHAKWAQELKDMGRNPGNPWKTQTDLIQIDGERDYITDRGDEVWNILEQRGIQNVILAGVHTNMCVLGRPFGLRQMARNGKHVVLMRDMTDTMYNPARWPYVSHFTGTDLIVSHIEQHVCPTITSDQIVGGTPFRFSGDQRAHVVFLVAEDEYETEQTLPTFAREQLGDDFRVSWVFGSPSDPRSLPGIEVIESADLLVISVRRKVFAEEVLNRIRNYVAQGKPVVGIRTASHAFAMRDSQDVGAGLVPWPEFDRDVLGGNYQGHHGNGLQGTATPARSAEHPLLLRGIKTESFPMGGSLYKNTPLSDGANVLMTGTVTGHPSEPVCWTFRRADGGRSFYTSLGHPRDFAQPSFVTLFRNGIYWAAGREVPDDSVRRRHEPFVTHWGTLELPGIWGENLPELRESRGEKSGGNAWYRCVIRIPDTWTSESKSIILTIPQIPQRAQITAWLNGKSFAEISATNNASSWSAKIDSKEVVSNDFNLLVMRVTCPPSTVQDNGGGDEKYALAAPVLSAPSSKPTDPNRKNQIELAGRWQCRLGTGDDWSNIPLPSKFGGSADIVFEPTEPPYVARPLTMPGLFTAGIEGPACDAHGNLLAVDFGEEGTIGRVSPSGQGEIFVRLPAGSVGNGIQMMDDGSFFVADYTRHNILRVDGATREVKIFAHNGNMNQPNDLARAPDGTLYASDPNWADGTGQLWRIDLDGRVTRVASQLGTTNGIEVSPDGSLLYVNESVQRNIWAYSIGRDKSLTNKRLIRDFPDFGFDGMRCDVEGNLYVTRHGKGTVVKLAPSGELLQEIDVLGSKPSNLCFGGRDGRTVFVTEVDFARVVQFRVDAPGATWKQLFGR